MADDPNPTLRAELLAALAVLAPQIRGLKDLATTSISPDLKVQIQDQIDARTRRARLIQAVVDSLDAVVAALVTLDADGYPALPAAAIMGSLFSELQEENSDLEAAVRVFAASQIAVGPLTLTPNPSPPTKAGP